MLSDTTGQGAPQPARRRQTPDTGRTHRQPARRITLRLTPRLLRGAGSFRRLLAAQIVSLAGDQISMIALPLVAVVFLHASAMQMGLLAGIAGLPTLLFSLHTGAWLDRRGHRRELMIAADLGRAFLLISIPVAWVLGVLTLWQLYVVGFAGTALSLLFSLSYATVFVAAVPPERYVEANCVIQGSRALSQAAGPSLGGILIHILTAPVAVILDALSFVTSAFLLARTRAQEPPVHETGRRQALLSGLSWIFGHRIIRATLAALTTINFFMFAFFALFVLYVSRSLHLPPQYLGIVFGGASIGGLAGSVLATPITRSLGIGPAFALGCVGYPAPLAIVPLASGSQSTTVVMLFLAQLGSGFGLILLEVSGGAIRAALVPDSLRSRVAGAHMLVDRGVRPLGALAGGVAAGSIGLRPTIAVAAVGAAVGTLWLLPSPLLRLRTLRVRRGHSSRHPRRTGGSRRAAATRGQRPWDRTRRARAMVARREVIRRSDLARARLPTTPRVRRPTARDQPRRLRVSER
jgi:MFS family permease